MFTIFFPCYTRIKEGETPTLLHLNGEFYVRMQHVSSTYSFHNLGLEGAELRASSSKNFMYRFATTA